MRLEMKKGKRKRKEGTLQSSAAPAVCQMAQDKESIKEAGKETQSPTKLLPHRSKAYSTTNFFFKAKPKQVLDKVKRVLEEPPQVIESEADHSASLEPPKKVSKVELVDLSDDDDTESSKAIVIVDSVIDLQGTTSTRNKKGAKCRIPNNNPIRLSSKTEEEFVLDPFLKSRLETSSQPLCSAPKGNQSVTLIIHEASSSTHPAEYHILSVHNTGIPFASKA